MHYITIHFRQNFLEESAASRESGGYHRPVELVQSDLDVCLIGLAIVLLDTEDLFDAADSVWLGGIQVAAFDVVRVFPVVFWVQLFIHRLLPWAFHRTGQLNAAEQQTLHLTEH